jgi:hypothetical protein
LSAFPWFIIFKWKRKANLLAAYESVTIDILFGNDAFSPAMLENTWREIVAWTSYVQ